MKLQRVIFLSYPITGQKAYYGGNRLNIETLIKRQEDRYNQETALTISSHSGTHMDFPAHFFPDGKKGDEYPPDFFIFHKAAVADLDLRENRRMVDVDIINKALDTDIDLLLIKTHYCEIRDQDSYWKDSPVVSASLCDYLRSRFTRLRAVGFDLISITSQRDKIEGRRAHKTFLDGSKGREIIPIEDVDLREVSRNTHFKRVTAAPLFFENMDGSPCLLIAEVE